MGLPRGGMGCTCTQFRDLQTNQTLPLPSWVTLGEDPNFSEPVLHLKNGALNTYCIRLLEESSTGIHESAAGIFTPLSPTGLKGAGDLLRFPLDSLGTPKRQPQK